MLVLTRREGQGLLVGEAMVTILRIGDGSVKVGIEAPQSVEILRDELLTDEVDNDEQD